MLRITRQNTRVKDLIDMVLLIRIRAFNFQALKYAVEKVFTIRNTHTFPSQLQPPPAEWKGPYQELANECLLSLSFEDAFEEIKKIHINLHQL